MKYHIWKDKSIKAELLKYVQFCFISSGNFLYAIAYHAVMKTVSQSVSHSLSHIPNLRISDFSKWDIDILDILYIL